MLHENYDTAWSTHPARTPGSSTSTLTERRSPSPTLTEALRGLGQGGATRSQILRGPVADGFGESKNNTRWIVPDTATNTSRAKRRLGRQKQQQQASSRLVKRKDHSVVVEVQTDEILDKLVHTVDQRHLHRRVQPESLPPLTQGVPSRGIFSKTKGHYTYRDTAHMLPVAKVPDRLSKVSKMSDVSRDGKEERLEQVEGGSGGVLNGNRANIASTGAGGAPLTKKQKVIRHYKKWWWLHLLVVIAIVILVVCLM